MSEVVSLAERRWWKGFDALFKCGMSLVEETATYLDGQGRIESKVLPSPLGYTYATLSMRLTTLLMKLISWLLLVRAFKEKELSQEEFVGQCAKLPTRSLKALTDEEILDMPSTIRSLAERANALLTDIQKADAEYLPNEGFHVHQSASG